MFRQQIHVLEEKEEEDEEEEKKNDEAEENLPELETFVGLTQVSFLGDCSGLESIDAQRLLSLCSVLSVSEFSVHTSRLMCKNVVELFDTLFEMPFPKRRFEASGLMSYL